jgi:HEAT repeat protein
LPEERREIRYNSCELWYEMADDRRTTEELFFASLEGNYDDEVAWDAVRVLRMRGTPEVFAAAVRFCRSAVPLERARGLDVLAQLGASLPNSDRPHRDESIAIAIDGLSDPAQRVIESAAWALAHLGGDTAVSALIPMRSDPDPDVRWAVANGLNGTERADAITTLIELMDDPNDNVRDWATFALGTQCSVDSPEIRQSLRKRLDDSYEEARAEAIWGLVLRKDSHGIEILIDRLRDDPWPGDQWAAADVLEVSHDTPVEKLRSGLQKLLPD